MEDKSFYDREDEQTRGIERFRALEGREKWKFFRTYYLRNTIVLLILLIAVVAAIVEWVSVQNDLNLYIAIIEEELSEESFLIGDEFVSYADTDEYDLTVNFDHSYVADLGMLNMKIGIGSVDLIIAEDSVHDIYQPGGYMDLEILLPEETWNKVEDYVVYALNEHGEEYAYGVDLANCEKYQRLDPTIEHPVVTVPIDSVNEEFSAQFISYLWE